MTDFFGTNRVKKHTYIIYVYIAALRAASWKGACSKMKRKILSVLSVLMAVLMSTAVLSACNKTPAGADSSGGSGESVSTEAGGEPSASESAAESSGESGKQSESDPEESFDYTGWQDFSYEMEAESFRLVTKNGKTFASNDTHVVYKAAINFKLSADFRVLQDVYGDKFYSSKSFDFYPSGFAIIDKTDYDKVRDNLLAGYNKNAIAIPNGYIVPADFSEPWYDYLVVKEARGDPDWMSAYHYDIYAEIDGGIFHAVVKEYGAFDENYDMSNAVAFIRQAIETVSITVDYNSQS